MYYYTWKEVQMKKQTAIFLSDYDRKCIEKLMEVYGLKSMGQVIRACIRAEAERLEKFKN